MHTKIIKIDKQNPEKNNDEIEYVGKVLRNGGLTAFPTETVYGLGANALDEAAVKNIYKAKGRPSDNPLIVHIGDVEYLDKLVLNVPDTARKLINKFWPGPITIIMKKKSIIPDIITAGLNTVAIRFPSNPIAQEIIKKSRVPIAAPSANTSGKPSPTTADHVIHDLSGKIDVIVDGGACDVGLESTVVDVSGGVPILLRPGGITYEQLQQTLGEVKIDDVVVKKVTGDMKPRSPGMKYTHYSPRAQVIVIEGDNNKVIEKINKLVADNKQKGLKVGVMTVDGMENCYNADYVLSCGKFNTPETIAANLFYCLRQFDDTDVDIIFAQSVPKKGIGLAIRNRLYKAAGYNIIKV